MQGNIVSGNYCMICNSYCCGHIFGSATVNQIQNMMGNAGLIGIPGQLAQIVTITGNKNRKLLLLRR